MQPEFLMRLGHAYRKQLPAEVFPKLKRARSFLEAGISLSFNSDRPIVPGNPWDGIKTATSRPEGFDPIENISQKEAIELYTKGGAIANSDSALLGAIEEGKLADFQVYGEGEEPVAVYLGGELVIGKGS
jgi:predicted amidohydrolase YtcJ